MEPLSALAVATSVVQLIDFGNSLLSEVGQPYRSSSGQDSEQVGLATIAYDLSLLANNVNIEMERLARPRPVEGSPRERFLRLCQQCSSAANDLSGGIRKLGTQNIEQSFTFAQMQHSSVDLGHRRKSSKIIHKEANVFAVAIKYAVSFNTYRWRGMLSDIRVRALQALKDVLWAQSARGEQALNRASVHQTQILTSLSQLESNTRTLNQSLINALNAEASSMDPAHREIIDSIWSSADLFPEPIRGPPVNSAQDESSGLMDIDQYSANLAARVRAQAKESESQAYVKTIINSLRFQGVKHREDIIPEAYEKTFQWLFEEELQSASQEKPWVGFTPWLEGSAQDLYWVTGNAGAGKSTLVKYLTTNPKTRHHLLHWAQDRPLIQASFYFWSAGVSQLQKSQTGLLRTLLLQCLEQMPNICPRVCPRRWALFKIFGPKAAQFAPPWSWGELLECFSALTPLAGREFNLALFIDGLDEFDGDHQKLIEFIKLFHRRAGIKILVSSRPENVFLDAFSANPSLKMEDFTTNDLENFVWSEFNRTKGYHELMQANPTQAVQIHKEIVQKAEGVFLWVSVVVLTLCECIKEGDNLKELLSFLGILPSDLSMLYMAVWDRLKPECKAEFSSLFQIHGSSTTLLDVTTLHLAEMGLDEALRQDISAVTGPLRPQLMQAMKKRLNSRTRGLLEISKDGQVDYLHRSVREWAVEMWPSICSMAKEAFDPHLAILQGLTVEIASPGIWESTAMNIPTEFWRRACICLYHASNVRDEPANAASLEKIMDRLDKNFGEVSTAYPLSNGRLPLYRDVCESSLMSAGGQSLPHWSTTQYTMTPDRQGNTFVGLAAQFAVLPYVRKRLADNRKLVKDQGHLTILSCAVLGFEHFCRPDVADLVGKYLNTSTLDTRLQLVELLVDKGALAASTKKARQAPSNSPYMSDAHQHQDIDGIHVQVNKKLQSLRSVSDVDPRELQYWEDVAALFVKQMTNEANHAKSKRLSLSRVLNGIMGKGRP